jgi:hypothetical protein
MALYVLHQSLERLAEAMPLSWRLLSAGLQVLAHQAKVDMNKAVAAAQDTERAGQEQQVASRVAACLGEMEARHRADLTELGAQHAAQLSSAKADHAAQLSAIESDLEHQRAASDQVSDVCRLLHVSCCKSKHYAMKGDSTASAVHITVKWLQDTTLCMMSLL